MHGAESGGPKCRVSSCSAAVVVLPLLVPLANSVGLYVILPTAMLTWALVSEAFIWPLPYRRGWPSIWLTSVPRHSRGWADALWPRVPSVVHIMSVITWLVTGTMADPLAWPRIPSLIKSLLSRRTLWDLETASQGQRHALSSQK